MTSKELENEIRNLLNAGHLIESYKKIRDETNCSLGDAKEYILELQGLKYQKHQEHIANMLETYWKRQDHIFDSKWTLIDQKENGYAIMTDENISVIPYLEKDLAMHIIDLHNKNLE